MYIGGRPVEIENESKSRKSNLKETNSIFLAKFDLCQGLSPYVLIL